MLIEHQVKKGRILFLASTKPLARQHLKSTKQNMKVDEDELVLLTGELPQKKRKELWSKKLIFSTLSIFRSKIYFDYLFVIGDIFGGSDGDFFTVVQYHHAVGKTHEYFH